MTAHKITLLGYQKIEGEIHCETGLHIGGSSEVIEIGGLDNPIIKHPVTNEPYIPGSSLKGKMRSLMELHYGLVRSDGKVHSFQDCKDFTCPVCRIFGVAGSDGSPFGPGRLIVRDAKIDRIKGQQEWDKNSKLTEIKYENVINRIKGTAEHPRQMERVPAGAVFSFTMSFRVFSVQENVEKKPDEGLKDTELFNRVLDCLKLIENDTLGGSGSRGYGQVKFNQIKVSDLDGKVTEVAISDRKINKPV